jgi:hypothetical protein
MTQEFSKPSCQRLGVRIQLSTATHALRYASPFALFAAQKVKTTPGKQCNDRKSFEKLDAGRLKV